jgi:uncharacterized membrane protein YciS (DUF1049 family)
MKKINVFCVLVLALMLIDLVVDLFFATSDRTVVLNLENESLGSLLFTLFVALLALGAVVVAIFSFVKFILNVNRNEVFTERNIKQIRKYGYSALVCGVCMMYLTFFFGEGFWNAVLDGVDALGEGFFALLMAEIFCIGKSR